MSSEQPQPFNVGDEVEHKCGIVGIVKACERRVVHGSTRWVVDIDAGNGEKIVQAWPHNCKLIKAAQTIPVRETESDVAEAVDNLLVANLCSALVRALKFHAGGDEVLRDTFGRIIREQLAEHRPNNAEADLRERLEEATQEFARALSLAQSLTDDVIGERDEAREELHEATAEFVRALSAANDQRDSALSELSIALDRADGWREVVAKCERLLKMNGRTPTDPNDSAVPLQLEHRLKSLALAENVIRDAKEVLKRKET